MQFGDTNQSINIIKIMNEDIAKAVLLLQTWPEECKALFEIQQSTSKSVFDLPEVRIQFTNFLQDFPVDFSLLQMIDGIRLNEVKNEVQYLQEVLDVSALLASKGAEPDTLEMFELILTDLKKRKQHKKLFQIARNLLDSLRLEGNIKNKGDMFKHIIKLNKFIGDAFSMQNKFDEALKYYKKACTLEEMLNSSGNFNSQETNAKTINHLGSRYFSQGNYDLAFEYFSKSLELTPSENKECLARVHNNIGLCLTEKQNYKEALNHFNDSLVLKKNADFVRQDSIARTLGNMANCYQKLGEDSSASMCHLACVQAKQQFKRQNSQRHQLTSVRVFDRSASLPTGCKSDKIPARNCQQQS